MAKSVDSIYIQNCLTDSLQVEAAGLEPWTTYNYQFTVCGSSNSSPVGRFRTTPTEDADVDEINFAVFSCSNYRKNSQHARREEITDLTFTSLANGYFNAYGNAARKDSQDYVVCTRYFFLLSLIPSDLASH